MAEWLIESVLGPMAEDLAQEMGIQIPLGTTGKIAGTYPYRHLSGCCTAWGLVLGSLW